MKQGTERNDGLAGCGDPLHLLRIGNPPAGPRFSCSVRLAVRLVFVMSQRTTPEAVQALLEVGGDYNTVTQPNLQIFIDWASPLVDQVVIFAGQKFFTLPTASQEIIERWLSAHGYVMMDQNLSQKTTAGASGTFQGQTGLNLDGSKYGQSAMAADWTGSLSAINKRAFASGFSTGRRGFGDFGPGFRGWW